MPALIREAARRVHPRALRLLTVPRAIFRAAPLVLALTLPPAAPVFATTASRDIPRTVTLRNFFGEGFTLERPVAIAEMPGHDSVFAVTQQSGTVVLVRREAGTWVRNTFDSVGVSSVNSGAAGEDGGLLGFAFHPAFAHNRKYYLFYVADVSVRPHPGRILLEERRAVPALTARDTTHPPRLVLSLDKPYVYHNGGTLRFGEAGEGNVLYTAIGDGGSGGDPQNRAQNKSVLWGKFLRIIPEGPDAYPDDPTRNYGIPDDNPFVDSAGYLPEIWAYGLRSPWKWDWNPLTGTIWLGDVGQSLYEEITTVPRGGNLGWRFREGAFCFSPATDCPAEGLTPPVFTFPSRAFGQSVTGGVFFTGDTTAAFHGVYLYGDFHHNRLYALRPTPDETGWTDTATLVDPVMNLVSLDRTRAGHILATSMATTSGITPNSGVVSILQSPDMRPAPEPVRVQAVRASGTRARPQLRLEDIRRHPHRYVIITLDGRLLTRVPSGPFLVRQKVGDKSSQLMTSVTP